MGEIKTRSLYNGTVNVEFNDGNHAYKVNGERCKISVTSATGMMDKPALKFWSVKMMKEYLINWIGDMGVPIFSIEELKSQIEEGSKAHTKFKDKAADLGTQVHDWAEQYILFELKINKEKPVIKKDFDERVKNGILAFLQWVDEHKIKFIASERLIYSKKYKYCGILDCKAKVDGKLTLVDFKTSNYMAIEYFAQVSAYAFADEEESGDEYDHCLILKFNKETGDFETKERNRDEMIEDFKAFRGLLEVKKWSDKYAVPFVKK